MATGTIPTPPNISEALNSTGQPVSNAQGLLLAHGNDPQGIDGIFGPNTTTATKAFQKAQGLNQDGVIGQDTWTDLVIN
jgi:peptidoglycan hydrolase-like protein with peptidoglycan-binding domain